MYNRSINDIYSIYTDCNRLLCMYRLALLMPTLTTSVAPRLLCIYRSAHNGLPHRVLGRVLLGGATVINIFTVCINKTLSSHLKRQLYCHLLSCISFIDLSSQLLDDDGPI